MRWASVKFPDPKRRREREGVRAILRPPFPFFDRGTVESTRMQWHEGIARPVTLAELGQRYRRYRLADPEAEDAMAGSLRRWGQLAPVVACVRSAKLELIDGFKRHAAARQLAGMTLSVRVLEVDEPTAKAAILGLNRGQRASASWRKPGSCKAWCVTTR